MKFRTKVISSILALLTTVAILGAAQSDPARVAFEAAKKKEVVDGDLNAAIQQYKAMVAKYAKERSVVADALIHMADCYQKLGDTQSKKIYAQVLRDYADQKDAASVARARLGSEAVTAGAGMGNAELSTKRVWVPPSTNLMAGEISPDGRFIVYAEYFTGGELTVHDLITGESRHVTHNRTSEASREYASSAVISRDQKKIAFAWNVSAGGQRELRLIDWDGTNQKTLYSNPEGYAFPNAWSSDGREILATISSGQGHTRQLAWIPVGGGLPRVLQTFAWETLGLVKAVSPDGRFIAYDAANPDGDIKKRTIYLLARDGSSQTAVTEGLAKDEVFGWMANGQALLFATDRTGSRELWALPVRDGKKMADPYPVKPDLGQAVSLGVSKDGTLLFSRTLSKGQIYTSSLDWATGKSSRPAAIAQSVVPEGGASWSPDGKQIAYVAHRGTEREPNNKFIVVHSLETGRDREVVAKQPLRISSGYTWSPDGKSYLVVGWGEKGRTGAFSVDLTTGDVRTLVQRELTAARPQWVPDGKQILYLFTEGRGVFVRNLETGMDREIQLGVPDFDRVDVELSPDGRQLAFSPRVGNRYRTLYVMAFPDGAPKRVAEFGADESILIEGWSPDAQRIILRRAAQKGPNVEWSNWWIPATGGELKHIEGLVGAFHPDGKQMVSAMTDNVIEFWTLHNLGTTLHSGQ